MAEEPGIEIPFVWIDPEAAEIQFVNQLMVQRQAGEWVLTFGQQTPPLFSGRTPEERVESAKEIPYVPVRVAARLGTTKQRLVEFVQVIQTLLEQEEQQGDKHA